MRRSPIPALCLQALASNPERTRSYTTSELRDLVACLGKPVTRDTIAKWALTLTKAGDIGQPPLVCRYDTSGLGEHRWELTSDGWERHRQEVLDSFAYCEPSTGTGLDTWHIRRLSPAGRMFGGGIDTPTVCGRTWFNGWDLEHDVTIANAFEMSRRFNDARRRDVCLNCANVLPMAVGAEARGEL